MTGRTVTLGQYKLVACEDGAWQVIDRPDTILSRHRHVLPDAVNEFAGRLNGYGAAAPLYRFMAEYAYAELSVITELKSVRATVKNKEDW